MMEEWDLLGRACNRRIGQVRGLFGSSSGGRTRLKCRGGPQSSACLCVHIVQQRASSCCCS